MRSYKVKEIGTHFRLLRENLEFSAHKRFVNE